MTGGKGNRLMGFIDKSFGTISASAIGMLAISP